MAARLGEPFELRGYAPPYGGGIADLNACASRLGNDVRLAMFIISLQIHSLDGNDNGLSPLVTYRIISKIDMTTISTMRAYPFSLHQSPGMNSLHPA